MDEALTDRAWPIGNDEERVRLLMSPREGIRRMVLDTDTYNEIDDQFALVHAVLARDCLEIEAIYAAPFHNDRSDSPGDGMRKSLDEIRQLLDRLGDDDTPVFEGANEWLAAGGSEPESSAAAEDLIYRALSPAEKPLYVVAIGAPTNIAAALLLEPEIARRIVVVWLGGNSLYWPTAREFNLKQDLLSSRILFDSGVPLVHVPCYNVSDHLITTREEVDRYVRPCGEVGEFLAGRYAEYVDDEVGRSKVIWDLAAVGWLLNPEWVTTSLVQSPILTSDMTWSRDPGRHLIAEVTALSRDGIFGDLFARLAELRA